MLEHEASKLITSWWRALPFNGVIWSVWHKHYDKCNIVSTPSIKRMIAKDNINWKWLKSTSEQTNEVEPGWSVRTLPCIVLYSHDNVPTIHCHDHCYEFTRWMDEWMNKWMDGWMGEETGEDNGNTNHNPTDGSTLTHRVVGVQSALVQWAPNKSSTGTRVRLGKYME